MAISPAILARELFCYAHFKEPMAKFGKLAFYKML